MYREYNQEPLNDNNIEKSELHMKSSEVEVRGIWSYISALYILFINYTMNLFDICKGNKYVNSPRRIELQT